MKVILPNQSVKEFQAGVTPLEIAGQISQGLAERAIAAKVNGEYRDLHTAILEDCALELITKKNEEDYLHVLRHTASHVMAQAVKRLYPDTKLAIGRRSRTGFIMILILQRRFRRLIS